MHRTNGTALIITCRPIITPVCSLVHSKAIQVPRYVAADGTSYPLQDLWFDLVNSMLHHCDRIWLPSYCVTK